MTKDDGIRPTKLENLAKLKAAFKPGGTTTAGTIILILLTLLSYVQNVRQVYNFIGNLLIVLQLTNFEFYSSEFSDYTFVIYYSKNVFQRLNNFWKL